MFVKTFAHLTEMLTYIGAYLSGRLLLFYYLVVENWKTKSFFEPSTAKAEFFLPWTSYMGVFGAKQERSGWLDRATTFEVEGHVTSSHRVVLEDYTKYDI